MILASTETPVSTLALDARGIVFWRYKDGAVIRLEDARDEVETLGKLVDAHFDRQCWLFINIAAIRSIDRESRRLFASDAIHHRYGVQALALILGSPVSSMIGNIYQSINRPRHPTRLFTNEDRALEWLLGTQDRSEA